jgi:exosortase
VRRFAKWFTWLLVILVIGFDYASVWKETVRDWVRDPNYHHGFLMPLVTGYLLWGRRSIFRSTPVVPSWWGLVGIVGALALLVIGTAAAEVFTQRMSFLFFAASLICFLFGWRHLKLAALPIAFLALAIPLPYVIYYGLTLPMQLQAARLAVAGLRVIGIPAVVQGNIIHLAGGTSLEVAEACSGIRSLYAFLAAGSLMAYSLPIAWWGRLLVFATAIPLTIAGNAFRVWGSGLGAWLVGPEATRGTAHEMFGLLVFVITLSLFYLIKKVVQRVWLHGTSRSLFSPSLPDSTPVSSEGGPQA